MTNLLFDLYICLVYIILSETFVTAIGVCLSVSGGFLKGGVWYAYKKRFYNPSTVSYYHFTDYPSSKEWVVNKERHPALSRVSF